MLTLSWVLPGASLFNLIDPPRFYGGGTKITQQKKQTRNKQANKQTNQSKLVDCSWRERHLIKHPEMALV